MHNLASKKIAILGLGDENVALISYLVKHGVERLTICDRKGREGLKTQIAKLQPTNIETALEVGENYLNNLQNFDIIFRSPGLPYLNEKILRAKEQGVIISSATKLFFELCHSPIIGVTGTKGKGTTATLISEILKTADKRVYLAGNIGNSPFEFLDTLNSDDIVILELSSFQLQDMDRSPHIAVVLDIKSDHLDYHQNQEEYVAAKENIVKYQTKDDIAIINADYPTSSAFGKLTTGRKYWFSRRKPVTPGSYLENDNIVLDLDNYKEIICNKNEVTLRGEHNLENICASLTAARLVGAELDAIKSTVKTFPGLEHRLEFVKEIRGTKFYNDSFSTTPDTAIAAIKSFSEPIILIAGGSEKNANYEELGKTIANSNIKTAILIGETGPKIEVSIKNNESRGIKIINSCKNLDEVIDAVKAEMQPGDVVLLSPASASFDWFKNYKDRGNQFKQAINKISL